MNPTIVERETMKFAGLSTLIRSSSNTRNDMTNVPSLWQELKPLISDLHSRVGTERYALIVGDLAERVGESYYHALVQVRDFEGLSESLVTFELPKGRRAMFTHKGPPETAGDTIIEMLRNWLPASQESISKNFELFIFHSGYDRNDPEGEFECCVFL
ncbi:MAG TPA: GyrI-like domain-containing protein [Verrucomicrobiae bacterium]|jgi:predicted transcriptional regulator YdeE|nr:GyrI-like domain-containing protein [Verrucomicrobiae bacterium]